MTALFPNMEESRGDNMWNMKNKRIIATIIALIMVMAMVLPLALEALI